MYTFFVVDSKESVFVLLSTCSSGMGTFCLCTFFVTDSKESVFVFFLSAFSSGMTGKGLVLETPFPVPETSLVRLAGKFRVYCLH